VTLFSKGKKKIVTIVRDKRLKPVSGIYSKRGLIKGTQKKTALRKFNFQRPKNMVRRVTIACEKVHICNPPVDYIVVRVHKVFYSTSAEIYSENWSR